MPFEFISSAENVAKQQQLWAMLFGAAGIALIIFMQVKGKPPIYSLIAIVILGVGGYFYYQSTQLKSNPGQWTIRIDDQQISWQSPNNKIDPSFTVPLNQIDYVDQSAMPSASNERPLYHLIMKDAAAIKLNDTSGIDLEQFIAHLNSVGIESRETRDYGTPVELRTINK